MFKFKKLNLTFFSEEGSDSKPTETTNSSKGDTITLTRNDLQTLITDEATKIVDSRLSELTPRIDRIDTSVKQMSDTIITDNKDKKQDVDFKRAFGISK